MISKKLQDSQKKSVSGERELKIVAKLEDVLEGMNLNQIRAMDTRDWETRVKHANEEAEQEEGKS